MIYIAMTEDQVENLFASKYIYHGVSIDYFLDIDRCLGYIGENNLDIDPPMILPVAIVCNEEDICVSMIRRDPKIPRFYPHTRSFSVQDFTFFVSKE